MREEADALLTSYLDEQVLRGICSAVSDGAAEIGLHLGRRLHAQHRRRRARLSTSSRQWRDNNGSGPRHRQGRG